MSQEYTVKLPIFEGPLDLLLHLIKSNEMEITEISISEITAQYLETIKILESLDLDIAGDFLVMAATLINIKLRSILPDPEEEVEEEGAQEEGDDYLTARALMQRLIEYRRFKEAALSLGGMAERQSLIFVREVALPTMNQAQADPAVRGDLDLLLDAFSRVIKFVHRRNYHEVQAEEYTVDDKIAMVRGRLVLESRVSIVELFAQCQVKIEMIVTLIALLELCRLKEARISQVDSYGDIVAFPRREGEDESPETAAGNGEAADAQALRQLEADILASRTGLVDNSAGDDDDENALLEGLEGAAEGGEAKSAPLSEATFEATPEAIAEALAQIEGLEPEEEEPVVDLGEIPSILLRPAAPKADAAEPPAGGDGSEAAAEGKTAEKIEEPGADEEAAAITETETEEAEAGAPSDEVRESEAAAEGETAEKIEEPGTDEEAAQEAAAAETAACESAARAEVAAALDEPERPRASFAEEPEEEGPLAADEADGEKAGRPEDLTDAADDAVRAEDGALPENTELPEDEERAEDYSLPEEGPAPEGAALPESAGRVEAAEAAEEAGDEAIEVYAPETGEDFEEALDAAADEPDEDNTSGDGGGVAPDEAAELAPEDQERPRAVALSELPEAEELAVGDEEPEREIEVETVPAPEVVEDFYAPEPEPEEDPFDPGDAFKPEFPDPFEYGEDVGAEEDEGDEDGFEDDREDEDSGEDGEDEEDEELLDETWDGAPGDDVKNEDDEIEDGAGDGNGEVLDNLEAETAIEAEAGAEPEAEHEVEIATEVALEDSGESEPEPQDVSAPADEPEAGDELSASAEQAGEPLDESPAAEEAVPEEAPVQPDEAAVSMPEAAPETEPALLPESEEEMAEAGAPETSETLETALLEEATGEPVAEPETGSEAPAMAAAQAPEPEVTVDEAALDELEAERPRLEEEITDATNADEPPMAPEEDNGEEPLIARAEPEAEEIASLEEKLEMVEDGPEGPAETGSAALENPDASPPAESGSPVETGGSEEPAQSPPSAPGPSAAEASELAQEGAELDPPALELSAPGAGDACESESDESALNEAEASEFEPRDSAPGESGEPAAEAIVAEPVQDEPLDVADIADQSCAERPEPEAAPAEAADADSAVTEPAVEACDAPAEDGVDGLAVASENETPETEAPQAETPEPEAPGEPPEETDGGKRVELLAPWLTRPAVRRQKKTVRGFGLGRPRPRRRAPGGKVKGNGRPAAAKGGKVKGGFGRPGIIRPIRRRRVWLGGPLIRDIARELAAASLPAEPDRLLKGLGRLPWHWRPGCGVMLLVMLLLGGAATLASLDAGRRVLERLAEKDRRDVRMAAAEPAAPEKIDERVGPWRSRRGE